MDVRPDFELPKYDGLKLEVEPVAVSPDEVENELENLRTRFGTLVTVDRPARRRPARPRASARRTSEGRSRGAHPPRR
nr:trigger factor [Pseudolysinimonas sp.]